jgi:hypothetical protein
LAIGHTSSDHGCSGCLCGVSMAQISDRRQATQNRMRSRPRKNEAIVEETALIFSIRKNFETADER